MRSSHEVDLSLRQSVEPTYIGDPDDHDFAALFEISEPVSRRWKALELGVGVGGTLLLQNNLPEGDQLTRHGLELLAIWGTVPAVYALGIIGWVAHLDEGHYDHRTYHTHRAAALLKAPLYAARRVKNWADRKARK